MEKKQVISFLGMYPREIKHEHTRICPQMFTAALSVITKVKNNPYVHQLMNG